MRKQKSTKPKKKYQGSVLDYSMYRETNDFVLRAKTHQKPSRAGGDTKRLKATKANRSSSNQAFKKRPGWLGLKPTKSKNYLRKSTNGSGKAKGSVSSGSRKFNPLQRSGEFFDFFGFFLMVRAVLDGFFTCFLLIKGTGDGFSWLFRCLLGVLIISKILDFFRKFIFVVPNLRKITTSGNGTGHAKVQKTLPIIDGKNMSRTQNSKFFDKKPKKWSKSEQ